MPYMANTRSYKYRAQDPGAASGGEPATARIADLAEDVVEAISEADRDWRAIERRVRELLDLVAHRACLRAADGDTSIALNATLALSQTQILAQVTDEASLDGRNMGLLAFNGALLGGTLAAKGLLGHYWWPPLVAVGIASMPCLWSALKKTSAYGPKARDFFELFGGRPGMEAQIQLLADLDDAFAFNAARIRAKELRLQLALGMLVVGLVAAALLIAVVRPATI